MSAEALYVYLINCDSSYLQIFVQSTVLHVLSDNHGMLDCQNKHRDKHEIPKKLK